MRTAQGAMRGPDRQFRHKRRLVECLTFPQCFEHLVSCDNKSWLSRFSSTQAGADRPAAAAVERLFCRSWPCATHRVWRGKLRWVLLPAGSQISTSSGHHLYRGAQRWPMLVGRHKFRCKRSKVQCLKTRRIAMVQSILVRMASRLGWGVRGGSTGCGRIDTLKPSSRQCNTVRILIVWRIETFVE